MPPMHWALATGNAHKVSEVAALLAGRIPMVPLPPPGDVPETGETFEANARLKLAAALAQPLPPEVTHVLAEDSGVLIAALPELLRERFRLEAPFADYPGVWSNRWLTPALAAQLGLAEPLDASARNTAVLRLLDGVSARSAAYVACVVCAEVATGQTWVGSGRLELSVLPAALGDGGFGYDPIMTPIGGDGRAVAQLSAEEKNAISHRGRAYRALLAQLEATAAEAT